MWKQVQKVSVVSSHAPSDAEDGDNPLIREEVQATPVFDSDSESDEPVFNILTDRYLHGTPVRYRGIN